MKTLTVLVTVLALLSSGCGRAESTPTPPRAASPADGVLAVMERSGGLEGNLYRLELRSDGTVHATNARERLSLKAPAPLVSELEDIFGSEGWRSLDEDYRGEPQPDHFMYSLGAGGRRVLTMDKIGPPALQEAIQRFKTLLFLSSCASDSARREEAVNSIDRQSAIPKSEVVATETSACAVGKEQTTVVYADGTVQLLHGGPQGRIYRTATVRKDLLRRLHGYVTGREWSELVSIYGSPTSSDIRHSFVANGKSVSTWGGADIPTVLGNVVGVFSSITADARQVTQYERTPAVSNTRDARMIEAKPTTFQATPTTGHFITLAGDQARLFSLPPDVKLVWQFKNEKFGQVQTRYQQVIAGAEVRGGQITVTRDAKGEQVLVIGSYYPDLAPTNRVAINDRTACVIAIRNERSTEECQTKLGIEPETGRLFFEVATRQGHVYRIDAEDGHKLN